MFRCTTEKYDQLYARWLENPGALLDFGEYNRSKSLLDLCGGTGAVSKEALRRGAKDVTLFDLNPRADRWPEIRCVQGDFHNFDDRAYLATRQYDFIVCRQAIAYLNLATLKKEIPALLAPGGRFVFNMFTNPKSYTRRYEYDGRKYLEASIVFAGRVFHLQSCAGVGSEISIFRQPNVDLVINSFTQIGHSHKRQVTNRSAWLMIEKAP